MSTRSLIAICILAPLIAIAGGGIILSPGSGWPVGQAGIIPSVGWTDDSTNGMHVLYYMDTLSGTNDSTIFNNDLIVSGPTWTTIGTNLIVGVNYGRTNLAYSFDGIDDWGNVNSADTGTKGLTNFSVMAWIKPPAGLSADPFVIYSAGNNGLNIGWLIYIGNDSKLYLKSRQDSDQDVISNTNAITYAAWNHIAVTYTNGDQRMFVNGSAVGTSNLTWDTFTPWAGAARIGAEYSGSAQVYFFKGLIDDIKVYDRVVSQTEISNHWYWTGGKYGNDHANYDDENK